MVGEQVYSGSPKDKKMTVYPEVRICGQSNKFL